MTNPKRDNAGAQPGEVGTAQKTKPKSINKIDRITHLLMTLPEGLNCFESPQYGDSCLHSTVAEIRKRYGDKLIQRWETVPSRFKPNGVRVLRYWLAGAN